MRLLTHNVLKNNCAEAKGNGYPLKLINVTSVRVDTTNTNDNDNDEETKLKIEFVKGILPTLHWSGLVQATKAVGIMTLPDQLLEDMVQDTTFLLALYHILLHVHVVNGILQCPITEKQFIIQNEIPNMIIDEIECERVRY